MEGWARWVGDMGEICLRRQTQHKPKTNPEQIDNEDEDPIEQIDDGAWGDGVSSRWVWGDGVSGWRSREEMREREKKMKRKKEERREAGFKKKKEKRNYFFNEKRERNLIYIYIYIYILASCYST